MITIETSASIQRRAMASSGFSLFEVLVTLIVITIGLLGIAKMHALAYASTANDTYDHHHIGRSFVGDGGLHVRSVPEYGLGGVRRSELGGVVTRVAAQCGSNN
jgi:prepilin-type N-terminal cleavage/methylation domain-containing protein